MLFTLSLEVSSSLANMTPHLDNFPRPPAHEHTAPGNINALGTAAKHLDAKGKLLKAC